MDIAHASAGNQRALLFRLKQAELDSLYETLEPVRISTLNGAFRGRVMGMSGIDRLPRPLRVMLYHIFQSPLNPWRGKYFASGAGSNLWLALNGQVRFAHYVVDSDPHTGIEFLNYNIAQNWQPLRGIRGEARQLDASTVLARMHYQTAQRSVRVLYFTLENH